MLEFYVKRHNNVYYYVRKSFERILAIGAAKLDRLEVRIKICFGALSRNFRAFSTSIYIDLLNVRRVCPIYTFKLGKPYIF